MMEEVKPSSETLCSLPKNEMMANVKLCLLTYTLFVYRFSFLHFLWPFLQFHSKRDLLLHVLLVDPALRLISRSPHINVKAKEACSFLAKLFLIFQFRSHN
jgi:hypothetical protein